MYLPVHLHTLLSKSSCHSMEFDSKAARMIAKEKFFFMLLIFG